MHTQTAASHAALRSELASGADLERYALASSPEIRQLLGSISEKNDLVTLYFDGSSDFVLTSVLAVNEQSLILDFGNDEGFNRRVLASKKLVCITSRDRIMVQWTSGPAEHVTFYGKPAFRIALPQNLLRLQRRECYRMATPFAKPLICNVPAGAERPSARLAFTVADISLGGMAVFGPMQQAGFEIGKVYEGCEIALPSLGTLVATVRIANIFEVTQKNGNRTTRAGCQFVNLQGKMLTTLQRYINLIEREFHERMARFA